MLTRILILISAFLAAPAVAESTFDRYEVVTGIANRQSVLTGFLLGGTVADLAVVHIDEHGDRRLRIYSFIDGSWVQNLGAKLRPGVSFVDVANIGGRDRLITYGGGRLSWLDPESEAERELVSVTSGFKPPRRDEIPHVDVTRDVSGDGRDDLVVPGVDGFLVFVQMPDGTFADPVKIGLRPDLSGIYGADGYRYDPWSQSRVHEIDYDGDGRGDLVFWNEDHFEVHRQDERGLFAAEAETFTTAVPFDSDDVFSLATGDMVGRVLHSLSDLNGDGVGDLVVISLLGAKASSKRSSYEVRFGSISPAGRTEFARDADVTFRSDRLQLKMDRHDLDRDGRVELMFTTIEHRFLTGSLWKRIKGAMGDDVRLELEFYRMEGARYPDAPNAVHRIALDGVPSHREPGWVPLDIVLRGPTHEKRKAQESWPRAFNTTVRIGDLTGDGHSDLLLSDHPRLIGVLAGVPGPDLFAARSTMKVSPPNDEEYTWLVDLNRDGKQDVVMHHPFTLRNAHGAPKLPPGTEPHRLVVLIAR